MSPDDLKTISKIVWFGYFLKGETIYLEGDKANHFYIVLSGECVSLARKSEE